MITEAGAAAVIAVTSHSPFGETERAAGRWLPYLRLFAAAGMCGLAIALLQLGAAGESLDQVILVLARNVTGITGIGLLCSLVTGGLLAWTLPLGYLAFCQYTLLQGWTARGLAGPPPGPKAAPGSAPAPSLRPGLLLFSARAAPAPASATKVSRIHRHTQGRRPPAPPGYRPRSPARPTPNQPAQNLSAHRRRGLGRSTEPHCSAALSRSCRTTARPTISATRAKLGPRRQRSVMGTADRRRRDSSAFASCRAGGYGRARKARLICSGAASRLNCLLGVQLGFMGVQLGGKVIWAGLRGGGCGAGTSGQQREAVAVLP